MKESRIFQPRWRKHNSEEREKEKEELQRTAEEKGLKYDSLQQAFNEAELEVLSDADWSILDNTRSNETSIRRWTKAKVIEIIGTTRDHESIFRGLEEGEELPVPIILFRKGELPYLIGGDTRLMACKVLGIRPMILAMRLPDSVPQNEQQEDTNPQKNTP